MKTSHRPRTRRWSRCCGRRRPGGEPRQRLRTRPGPRTRPPGVAALAGPPQAPEPRPLLTGPRPLLAGSHRRRPRPPGAARRSSPTRTGPARPGHLVHRRAVPAGIVVFAHGSGSGRLSRRNRWSPTPAQRRCGHPPHRPADRTRRHRRSGPPVRHRAAGRTGRGDRRGSPPTAHRWARHVGLFGASTGGGGRGSGAAVQRPAADVAGDVSRGGRPDLAGPRRPAPASPRPCSSSAGTTTR